MMSSHFNRTTRRAGVAGLGIALLLTPGAVLSAGAAHAAATTTTPTISAVRFLGSPAAPEVVVTGSGFGTTPPPTLPPTPHCPVKAGYGTIHDGTFWLDFATFWAGNKTNCVGVNIASWKPNHIVYSFGSDYAYYSPWTLYQGGTYTMIIEGAQYSGRVKFHSPQISSVTIGGSPAAPTVVVTGTGFGPHAPFHTRTPESGSAGTCVNHPSTGKAFGKLLGFTDTTAGWSAGGSSDCVGLDVTHWSEKQITLGFGSNYGQAGATLAATDKFTFSLLGTTFTSPAS